MPKTKFQSFIFGALMSIIMAYGMEVYNISIQYGGLSNIVFFDALKETAYMCVIVYIISTLYGNRLAKKLAFSKVNPETDNPFLVTIMVSACTVLIMCPTMSAIATILFNYVLPHKGLDSEIFANYVATLIRNFPMAVLWQFFAAGPLVRTIFKAIFKKQLQEN